MPAITQHRYSGAADLRAMQSLAQSIWSQNGRFHIGDLAWQRFEHEGREANWPTMLWQEDGAVIGWGWAHRAESNLYLMARPELPEIVGDIIDWFEKSVSGATLNATVLDKETHLANALATRGYVIQPNGPFDLYMRLDLAKLPPKPLMMSGLQVRSMAQSGDVERRAASHRAAWHPSRVTSASYRNVLAAWPYRAELDWFIEVSDGRYVANCCLWHDDKNSVALLEPVGVDPAFRRLGLGRAVCLHALHKLREIGSGSAITYPRGDDAYPIPKMLYLGMGFEPYARTQTFVKRR